MNLWKDQFDKNQRRFIYNGIVSSSHDTLVLTIFLTGYALWLGATDSQAGMISSILFMAQLLQVLFVSLWKRVKVKKRVIPIVAFASRFIIFLVVILPNLVNRHKLIELPVLGSISMGFLVFLGVFFVGTTVGSSAGIQMNLWMMRIVPRDIRGTFFSSRNRITMILSMVISFVISKMLDYFRINQRDYWGFLIIFSLALILAFLDMLIVNSIGDVEEVERQISNNNPLSELLIPLKDSYYMRMLVCMALWALASQITLPFLGVYQISQLRIGYLSIALLTSLQTFFSFVSAKLWGQLANRKSWMRIYNLSVLLFVIQMFTWLFVTSSHGLFLIAVYLQAGIFGPAYMMAIFNLPYSYLKKGSETVYISVATIVLSIANILGVFIGGWVLNKKLLNGWQFTDHYLSNNIALTIILGIIAILFGRFFVSYDERNE